MIDIHPKSARLRRAVLGVASLSCVALIVPACDVDKGGPDIGQSAGAVTDACHAARSSIQYTERLHFLGTPLSALCLPVDMLTNDHAEASCVVVEGRSVGAGSAAACNACTSPGRQPLHALRQPLADQMQQENPSAALDCFCEIEQTSASPQDPGSSPCQYDPSPAPVDSQGNPVDGFCYVANDGPGDPALVEVCPENERRALRFVGAGMPVTGSFVYALCVTDAYHPPPPDCAAD